MQLTLLLPAQTHLSSSVAPSLARWRARGDRVDAAKAGREAQLRTYFEFHGPALPIAALTRSVDANDADSAQWLRCDPAYVMADAVTLRLIACGDLRLSAEEVEEFSRVLKPLFGDAGFPLEAQRPDRWYLRCPREAKLPRFSDPADALGDDLARHLPEGDNMRQWRSLLNEAQIALTQHPLNAQRTRSGLPPVNSVWIWGAGLLPQWVRSGLSLACTSDEIVEVLARLSKVPSFPRKRESSFSSIAKEQELDSGFHRNDEQRDMLIDLTDLRDLAELERDWFAPIDALLAKRKLEAMHLHFLDGARTTYKHSHRWRFWRRVKT